MPRKRTKDDEREMQSKYVQYQMMKQQLNLLVERKNAVDEQINELNSTINALNKLEKIRNGEEIWSPLGSGSFVRSDIKDTEKVMIAIGAGVVTQEERTRAIEILQGRLDEFNTAHGDIIADIQNLGEAVGKLESELERLAHEAENK